MESARLLAVFAVAAALVGGALGSAPERKPQLDRARD